MLEILIIVVLIIVLWRLGKHVTKAVDWLTTWGIALQDSLNARKSSIEHKDKIQQKNKRAADEILSIREGTGNDNYHQQVHDEIERMLDEVGKVPPPRA